MNAALKPIGDKRWSLSGRIDFDTAPTLVGSLDENNASIDLAEVERSNSAAIALLLEWRRRFPDTTFSNPPEQIVNLAEFGGVSALLFQKP